MLPHQVEKTVHDRILGATRLQPRRGDFVADLLERSVIGKYIRSIRWRASP